MRVKQGVELWGLSREAWKLAQEAERIWQANGMIETTITSGRDGTHKGGSKHYEGQALDFRIYDIPIGKVSKVLAQLQSTMGSDYDVILEKDHIHGEYDPKG